jgi:C4-dicarboxylate-specific signal transduction histidine kinase
LGKQEISDVQDRTDSAPEYERHRLQECMMRAFRMATVGEVTTGVAHEMNQPLTAITNYARACELLLSNESGVAPEIAEALREIGLEAERAAAIIRRLRGLVQNDPVERTATDINDMVGELADLMRTDASLQGVRLRVELGNPLPSVAVDRARIQLVLLNLFRNSLEALHTPLEGLREVAVRTAVSEDGQVEFSVTDSGPGVPQDVVNRLFTPFLTTKPNGTGLGLVTSQTIVRAHQGTLGFAPQVPRGARFFVRLPAMER